MELALSVYRYALPLSAPIVTSRSVLRAREGYLVGATHACGKSGYGDISPLPGHGVGRPEDVPDVLRETAIALAGIGGDDPVPSTAKALGELSHLLAPASSRCPAVLAGVTAALADLAARMAGQPLAKWLDPESAGSVAVNALISAADPASAGEAALAAVESGFETLKLKVGGAGRGDVELVAAVRASIGPRIALRADANGAWSIDEAVDRLRALEPLRLEYVEQPVPAADIAGLAQVRRESPVPIAADESLLIPGGPDAVLKMDAADILVIKPSLIGGIAVTLGLAERARLNNVPVVLTSALESAVGRLGALHLAAGLCSAGQRYAFGLATGSALAEDVIALSSAVEGRLHVPQEPGLGYVPDLDFELL